MLTSISIPYSPEYYKEFVAKNNIIARDPGTSRLSRASVLPSRPLRYVVIFFATNGDENAC